MSDTTTPNDEELKQFILAKSEYWFMVETNTGNWVVDENAMMRDLVPYIHSRDTKRDIESRVDELNLIVEYTGLFTKKRNKAVYNVYLPIQYLLDRVAALKKRKNELTSQQTKESL
jgi:hypothetical protein